MKKLILLLLVASSLSAQVQRWTVPQRVKDSTTSILPIQFLVTNDTIKAWIERDIAGDHFTTYLRVRSLGRSESGIYAGIEAVSKGNDTVLAGVRVSPDGVRMLLSDVTKVTLGSSGLRSSTPFAVGSNGNWLDSVKTSADTLFVWSGGKQYRVGVGALAGSATKQNLIDSLNAASPLISNLTSQFRFSNVANDFFGDTVSANKGVFTSTTEQLRLGYDASKYSTFTISSAGNLTIAPTGTVIDLFNTATDNSLRLFTSGTSNAISVTLQTGNATTSGRYAYSRFLTSETVGHDWRFGMVGNKDFGIFNYTLSSSIPAIAIDDATSNIGIGLTYGTAGSAKLHVVSTTEQLRLGYDADNRLSFTQAGSGGAVTVVGTGDWIFNMTGKDIYPYANYDQNLGLLSKKYLTLHAAELWVETLVAQNTIATIGGRVLVAPTTPLVVDLSTDSTYIQTKYNNLANGDRVYMEADSKVEFMAITSAAATDGSYYRYSVTRDLDGSGANVWYAGDAVLNTGTTGDGFIDLYSVNGVMSASDYGPTITGVVRTGTTYSDLSERWAIGNLNGLFGYSSDTYGAAFGVPTGNWLKIDPTNGVRIGNNATTYMQLTGTTLTLTGNVTGTASGNVAMGGSAADVNSGATTISAGKILISGSTELSDWSHGSDATKIDGGDIYTSSVTAAKISVDSLGALSANLGTITGGSLNIGSGTFKVTPLGALTATSATITGTISTTDLTASDGSGQTLRVVGGVGVKIYDGSIGYSFVGASLQAYGGTEGWTLNQSTSVPAWAAYDVAPTDASYYVAATSGGSPTTQLRKIVLTIGGVQYSVLVQ